MPRSPIERAVDAMIRSINLIDDEDIRKLVACSFLEYAETLQEAAKAGRLSLV